MTFFWYDESSSALRCWKGLEGGVLGVAIDG
jgi:hypothetical protein